MEGHDFEGDQVDSQFFLGLIGVAIVVALATLGYCWYQRVSRISAQVRAEEEAAKVASEQGEDEESCSSCSQSRSMSQANSPDRLHRRRPDLTPVKIVEVGESDQSHTGRDTIVPRVSHLEVPVDTARVVETDRPIFVDTDMDIRFES